MSPHHPPSTDHSAYLQPSIPPGMLADRYSCFPTALVGAGLAATGYTILGMGWVTVGSGGSSRVAVAATVFTFAFGVAWIYASAFVTAITTADDDVRGRVVGVAMCGFYASSAWFTEVTEYCCNATTTAEISAWRHTPIAITALICSPGLATSYRKSGSVSSKDVGMTSLYCSVIVAMSLGAYQVSDVSTSILTLLSRDAATTRPRRPDTNSPSIYPSPSVERDGRLRQPRSEFLRVRRYHVYVPGGLHWRQYILRRAQRA